MITLATARPSGNYLVQGFDSRYGVEQEHRCESLDDVAYWLATNDYEWTGKGFFRQFHGKTLLAQVSDGFGPLSPDALRVSLLPRYARESCLT